MAIEHSKYGILHFADYYPDFSGSFIETLQQLGLSLAIQDVELFLFVPFYKEWHSKLTRNNLRIEIFPSPELVNPFSTIKSLFKFKTKIIKYNIKIVHCHFSRDYVLFVILYKIFFNRKIKIIWHWHNPAATVVGVDNNYLKKILRNQYYKFISRFIDLHIAISSEIFLWLKSICSNIEYVPNGISLKKFNVNSFDHKLNIKEEFGLPANSKILCTVANFRPQKDYHTLLMAAKEIIDSSKCTYFLFVGDGPTKPAIQKLSDELGISNKIIFTGFREDIQRIIYFSDIFILSTHYEGMPYVLCEAMALSKPIIATNVSGCRDLVKQGTGILIKHQDYKDLSKNLLMLLNDPELAQSLGDNGKRIVETEFTLEKQCETLLKTYKLLDESVFK